MPRLVQKPVSVFSFALVLVFAAVLWARGGSTAGTVSAGSISGSSTPSATNDAAPSPLPYVVPNDFAVTMIRAGLDADALAAVGVSANGVVNVLQPAADAINNAPSALSTADAAFAAARVESDRLQRLIQSGRGSSEDVTSYQTQSAVLATATSQRQSVLDGYFTAAIAGLSSDQRTQITRLRANRSWNLPLEFLVVNREQAEWVAVRDALANERISAKLGESPDESAQASLTTWRAVSAVSTAKSNLDANRATVRAAWNTAVGG